MNTKGCAVMLFAVCALVWPDSDAQAKRDDLPRLPGAELLMGYPPYSLIVTTPTKTWKLQEDKDDSAVNPSMSRDGMVIASGQVKGSNPRRAAVATYAMAEGKWREYQEFESGGSVAISPDGSKLAFDDSKPGTAKGVHMRFIDLKTGTESVGAVIGPYNAIGLSWSPDGSRIAYGMNQSLPTEGPGHSPAIEILKVETGKIWKVAEGKSPAWSPSGEWIAYLNDSDWPNQVWMVHPDGTGSRLLVTLPRGVFLGQRMFREPPVWSPDSTKLLLNELYDADKWTFNIHLLDLATLKLTRKFKDQAPVYGWAEAK